MGSEVGEIPWQRICNNKNYLYSAVIRTNPGLGTVSEQSAHHRVYHGVGRSKNSVFDNNGERALFNALVRSECESDFGLLHS